MDDIANKKMRKNEREAKQKSKSMIPSSNEDKYVRFKIEVNAFNEKLINFFT